jgi:hypothetical protein
VNPHRGEKQILISSYQSTQKPNGVMMKPNTIHRRSALSKSQIPRPSNCIPRRRHWLLFSSRLVLLLWAWPAVVQAQFIYTTNSGTITITGYTGSGGAVTIPAIITGLPVTSIGDYAFYEFTSLTSVTIGNGVTSIGDYAFNGCYSLTSVTIPNSVTSLGHGAFAACGLTSITIPNSVTSIGGFAFGGCSSLASVTLGNSVTSIGGAAFSYCTSLTSITIPNSVTTIGEQVFYECYSLSAITVDALNPAYISVSGVLFNKSQTALIQYPAGKAGSQYAIPNSVTSIRDYAFLYCTNLTSVTIPNSVTTIGDQAFYECYSLTSVAIPNSVTNIGGWAFRGCTHLTSITIPNSVASMGNWAFGSCTNLTSVTLGNSVTSIGDYAFYECTILASVYFQGNAPSLGGSSVFNNAINATIFYLPGTTGWGATFGGRPTALWVLPNPLILSFGPNFGVQTNGFGFIISWATNLPVVVEASTTLINPTWTPLSTNTLNSGSSYFSDPQWSNYPSRFYRLRSP